ncbi:MAG: hypothetical protein JWL76_1360 [Thermoleophilia bacterium]|nr:hypothetical protein [Thermoleophilia bacterium]
MAQSEAYSSSYPWSGYWWPQKQDPTTTWNLYDDGGPLALYDQYVQATRGYNPGAQQWQAQHKANDASWAGHCQAWAAASILTREPPRDGVTKAGVTFGQDALEGLITSVYEVPSIAGFWGQRNDTSAPGTGIPRDDFDPAWMDYLLRYYVQEHGSSFVMDTDPGSPVWNFPVAGFERSTSKNGDGSVRVKTDVWFRKPSAGVAGYDPNSFFRKTYEYDLWNTADGTGSTGRWVSADRPDFAWAADGHKASDGQTRRNPHLDPKIVEEILGYGIG